MKIYIVRHGQTDYNINGRYGGRIDISLNKVGIKEAKEVKEKLKDIKFDLVFSSPLTRAYDTARIIYDGEIIKDNRIIERSNGDLEGKLKSDIKEKIDFNSDDNNIYNIEPITSFRSRIYDFFNDIIKNYKDKTILVVTHAGVGIFARCYFEGEPVNNDYSTYKMRNGEILEYELKK